MRKTIVKGRIQDIYLGLVAKAHYHLAQEAPSVAVAAEQLRQGGVEGPVTLQSKNKKVGYLKSAIILTQVL